MLKRVLMLCVFLLLPITAQAQTDSTVVDECTKLLAADRPMPTGADAPSVRIVQPVEDVIYGSAITITIETENFDVTSDGRHWHLWVNGQLQGMVYQPTAIIDLEPGDYQICASLGNTDHADLGEPAGIALRVERAAAGTPTPTLIVPREQAVVQPEPTLGPGQIILVIGLGLLAAVGGWWLGSRLPKNRKPQP